MPEAAEEHSSEREAGQAVWPGGLKARGRVRVLLVDDSAVVRERLCALLAEVDGVEVAGEAADVAEAEAAAARLAPDAIVLVVEDDPGIRELTAAFLSAHGYVVDTVEDGTTMRAALARETYALVVLDVMMPGEDGLSILRSLDRATSPAVIILSVIGEEVDRIVGTDQQAHGKAPIELGFDVPRHFDAVDDEVVHEAVDLDVSHGDSHEPRLVELALPELRANKIFPHEPPHTSQR